MRYFLVLLVVSIGSPLFLYYKVLRKRDLVSRFVWVAVAVPVVSIISSIVCIYLSGVFSVLLGKLAEPGASTQKWKLPQSLFHAMGNCELGLFGWPILLAALAFLYCFTDTIVAAVRAQAHRCDNITEGPT